MKLFSSLGLSPSDLDALAQIPDEDITMETLPRILMQLKSRKGAAGERGAAASEAAFRGGRDGWDPSPGQARNQSSGDFGFGSMRDGYGSGSGSGSGYGMGVSSDPLFMQRRMGAPSSGKIQDFLGVAPPMYPHVCSLCDFDVHSSMEWNHHTAGLRHAENRRRLLDMYPDWEPGRRGRRDGPNLSAGLLGPSPMSSGPLGGMSSSWGGRGRSELPMGQNTFWCRPQLRSRVVVVKYDRKPLSNKTLFAFTETFGRLREHPLRFAPQAFLEMESHEAAANMVAFYKQHPTKLYGKPVTFYLSQRLMVIEKSHRGADPAADRPSRDVVGHGSKVVFFANLPKDDDQKKELLTIARRFGTVDKHLFLTDQVTIRTASEPDRDKRGAELQLSSSDFIVWKRTLMIKKPQKRTANQKFYEHDDQRGKHETKTSLKDGEHFMTIILLKGSKMVAILKNGSHPKIPVADRKYEKPSDLRGYHANIIAIKRILNSDQDSSDDDITEGGAKKEAGVPAEDPETKEEESVEAPDDGDEVSQFDQSFLENMEDFVTLDELDEDDGDEGDDGIVADMQNSGFYVADCMNLELYGSVNNKYGCSRSSFSSSSLFPPHLQGAEEPPAKKQKHNQSQRGEDMEMSTNQNGQTEAPPPAEPSVAALPPYDPNNPVGVEHVKMGYYCRLCFLFYSNEEKAKKAHCSSQAHYDKLQVVVSLFIQKHLEKER
uniref:Matrin-type domain-containing protein n=1 Tax=Poecilia formosa TaxID=48698 RepID=A0A087XEM9_POEFO